MPPPATKSILTGGGSVIFIIAGIYMFHLFQLLGPVLWPESFLERQDADGNTYAVITPKYIPGKTSMSVTASILRPSTQSRHTIWDTKITYGWPPEDLVTDGAGRKTNSTQIRELGPLSTFAPEWVTKALEKNETLELHFTVTADGDPTPRTLTIPLVQFRKRFLWKEKREKRRLVIIDESWPWLFQHWFPPTPKPVPTIAAAGVDENLIGFWRPKLMMHLVVDSTHWPVPAMQYHPIAQRLNIDRKSVRGNKKGEVISAQYLAHLSGLNMDEISSSRIQINTTDAGRLPLTIGVEPMSVNRFTIYSLFTEGFKVHTSMGTMNDNDFDEVRSLFTENTPAMLILTFFVSFVHMIFDALAFKSEIQFWSGLQSARGVSVRSMVASMVGQIIVTLYLMDQDASKLVLLPMVFGLAVQAWKIMRALGLKGKEGVTTTGSNSGSGTTITIMEQKADADAMWYMSLTIAPLVIGYCLVTLLRDEHESFASWGLSSLAACVYGGGFVLMFPQVFLNYRMKSVAAMDWTTLGYRFFNTFIDDFFAFLIPMPGMHRLAVFRDDLVFCIFMSQWWLYPERKDDEKEKGD